MKKIITVCLVAVLFIGSLAICVDALKAPEPVDYETYVVRSGDTLWEIAKESNGWNKMDAYEIIDDIEKASDCSALIYPGQIVYIPVYDFGGK
jgi:LysM repeat protein